MAVIVGLEPDPGNAERIEAWAKAYGQELHPTAAGGTYVNSLMNDGADRVRDSYRTNQPRLTAIKKRYDPGQPVPRQPEHPAGGSP